MAPYSRFQNNAGTCTSGARQTEHMTVAPTTCWARFRSGGLNCRAVQSRNASNARKSALPRWRGTNTFALELHYRSQSEHLGISQCFAGIVAQGIGRAPAWMNDVLEIRLQRPPGADLVLVDGGEQPFETPDRPARPE